MRAWVDSVSEPGRERSKSATRSPARDSSIAVAAPATRPPTTMTSYSFMRLLEDERPTPFGCRQGSRRQVGHDGVRVVAGPVDEPGVAAVLKALADDVDPRSVGHAAVLADGAVLGLDGQVHPRVVGAVAGARTTVRMPSACRSRRGGAAARCDRGGPAHRPHLAGQSGVIDVLVNGVEESPQAPLRVGDVVRQPLAERRAVAVDAQEASAQPHAATLQGSQVDVGVGHRVPRCDRSPEVTARGGRRRDPGPRRSCGRADRWRSATRTRPCRGTGAAFGCAGRPRAPPHDPTWPTRRRSVRRRRRLPRRGRRRG